MSDSIISILSDQIVQMSRSIAVLLDRDGIIQEVNPIFEQITGYTASQLWGRNFFKDFLEPHTHNPIEAMPHKNGALSAIPHVTAITAANGKTVYIGWVLKKIKLGDKRTSRILAAGRDVSDIVKNEKASMAERAELIERNKELTCLYKMASIMVGSSSDLSQLIQSIAAILPPAFQYPDLAAARIQLDGRYYSSESFVDSDNLIREDLIIQGEPRGVVEVVYKQFHTASSSKVRFLPEELDLLKTIASQSALMIEKKLADDLKSELEGQLRHADRLAKIGQLAAGLGHEINEPLGAILGFAQLAAKNLGAPDQVGRDLDRIIQSALHAREIIKKLMLFSRQMPNRTMRTDLNSLVNDTLSFIQPRFEKKGIEFVRKLGPFLPTIDADPSQITQVLVNLLINGIQAMGQTGKLTISTTSEESEVVLMVQDTGAGIAPDIIPHIFLPFFTTKDIDQGSGLGLSVVHGIITNHDGRIDVQSQPGVGSCFSIRLPAASGETHA